MIQRTNGWFLGVCIALCLSGSLFGKVVNRMVATINGEAVLGSELEKNVTSVVDLQKARNPKLVLSEEELNALRRNVLEQMIDDKLMLQEAKKEKIKVVQRDVEKGIQQVKDRFKRDEKGNILSEKAAEEAFKNELQREGITNKQFEERIRDQVIVINLIDQKVKAHVPEPKEDEIQDIFDKVKKVLAGEKLKGMDEEERKLLEQLAKYFGDSVAERVRCRHILIQADPKASFKEKNMARRKIGDIQKKLKAGADFAQLAREYSEDTQSAKNGGELDFFVRGWMVPEFERAAFALRVGEVSDIVETEFGYHLIRCEEMKSAASLTLDLVRDEISAYTYQQKAKVKFEEWIKDIRAKANIQIKDETLKKAIKQ